MKYKVDLEYTICGSVVVEVEADSDVEAMNIAEDLEDACINHVVRGGGYLEIEAVSLEKILDILPKV